MSTVPIPSLFSFGQTDLLILNCDDYDLACLLRVREGHREQNISISISGRNSR